MSMTEESSSLDSLVEQLELNRRSFYILKLEWEVERIVDLTKAILRNDTVKYVFFYDQFFSSLSMNERRELLKALGTLPKLESLVYISHSTRVKFPVDALAELLRTSKKLTTFELHGPNLVGKPADFDAFHHSLGRLPWLKTFKLLPGFFGSGSVDLDHLISALSKLQYLEEIRICLYCDKTSPLSAAELEKLCRSEVLRVLDFRWPHMTDDHLKAIAFELRFNNTLKELRIGGNELVYSCYSVSDMLEVNKSLECLSLACKGLSSDDMCIAFWKSFDMNTHLREITLENTGASVPYERDLGCTELLGRVLADNTSIETLRLYNMDIDDAACYSIARGLQVNTKLRELDLRKGNRNITSEGFATLAQMLERNYTLQSLQTNATGAIKHQIDVCLKLNKSAKKIEADIDSSTKDKLTVTNIFSCSVCR